METVKCIKERRSVRKFDASKEISKELIDSVIDTARGFFIVCKKELSGHKSEA